MTHAQIIAQARAANRRALNTPWDEPAGEPDTRTDEQIITDHKAGQRRTAARLRSIARYGEVID